MNRIMDLETAIAIVEKVYPLEEINYDTNLAPLNHIPILFERQGIKKVLQLLRQINNGEYKNAEHVLKGG